MTKARTHDGSLRLRILIPVILTVLTVVGTMFLFTRAALLDEVTDGANSDVVQELDEFERFVQEASSPESPISFGSSREMVTYYISRQIPGDNETMLGIAEGRGIIQPDLSQMGPKHIEPLNLNAPIVEEIQTSPQPSGVFNSPERGQIHWGRIQIDSGPDGDPVAFAVLSFVQEDIDRAEAQVRWLAALGVGLLLLAIAAVWLVVNRILRPISELEEVSSSISNSDLTSRVPVHSNDEIGRLAATFNAMLDRLETAYHDQRNFVDDAGHELRTPITVVRGQLELLEHSSPEEQKRSVELATAELDRMSRMVNDLLILAVSDAGTLVEKETVDVAELTIDIEDKAETLSDRIQLVAVAEGQVDLDEQRITQAVLELCRNALRYSDGTVDVGSAMVEAPASSQVGSQAGLQLGSQFEIWVEDRGQGIAPDKQDKLFARFARGDQPDASRPSGAGLGLSIVDAIAKAHGGSVRVESEVGKGSKFTIAVPVAGAAGVAQD